MARASRNAEPGIVPPLLEKLQARQLIGKLPAKPRNLTEVLAGQISLSNSITLAGKLMDLDGQRVDETPGFEQPEKVFLNARAGMIRHLADSFDSQKSSPFSVPKPSLEMLKSDGDSLQAFKQFYSLQQSELELRANNARRAMRAYLALGGEAQQRLHVLDRLGEEALRDFGRSQFAKLPPRLIDDFKRRRAAVAAQTDQAGEPESWLEPEGWLYPFYQNLRELLLAEVDARLLPARALLDTLIRMETR